MRDPISIFPPKVGEDPKKGIHVHRCRVFTKNIGEDQKKSSSLFVMIEAPHFLRGPRLQPA